MMIIRKDDITDPSVIQLLLQHVHEMRETSPPESVHALDVAQLKEEGLTMFSGWIDHKLAGVIALKELTSEHGEIKSMRTADGFLRSGVASKLLTYSIEEARTRGYRELSLETGAEPFFEPARSLYSRYGFSVCPPYADYWDDPNSVFMTMVLKESD